MALTEKKVITSNPNTVNLSKHPAVNFEVDRFDAAVLQKGYTVLHSKALKCPCMNYASNSPLPNCLNCSGIGWFYVDKTETKALMQSMGNSKKYEVWSETNAGTVQVTTLFKDDVTYMDKFEITDLEATFSQILFLTTAQDKIFSFTIYEPIEVLYIYKFVDSNSPLVILYNKDVNPIDWDYYVEKNRIIFNPSKFSVGNTVTIRYKHVPVYCIIDITREIFKTKDKGCSVGCEELDLTLRGMPQKSIGRRLHYIWNANNLNGPKEHDNTDPAKYDSSIIV